MMTTDELKLVLEQLRATPVTEGAFDSSFCSGCGVEMDAVSGDDKMGVPALGVRWVPLRKPHEVDCRYLQSVALLEREIAHSETVAALQDMIRLWQKGP